jgi:acyl-CoA thioesterase-1
MALIFFLAGGALDSPAQARTLRIAALGDSLTAGFGLKSEDGFTSVLAKELRAKGHDLEILNFGVSGDTTAGGVSRVGAVIAARPDGVILELGANDALRGFEPSLAEANLDRIIAALRQAGIPVMLTGMRAMLGMGRDYGQEFAAIYPRLAAKYGLLLYPFFLEGVAGDPALNQYDGLHPNPQGVRELVRRILPDVETFLKAQPGK